jgi:ribonuclease HI
LAVKEAAPFFLSNSLKFFTRKLTKKRLETQLEHILLARGFLQQEWAAKHHPIPQAQLEQLQQLTPEMVHLQYKRDPNHPRASFLHLQLSKEEAVQATTSLVASLKDSNTWIIYTDGSYDLEEGGACAAVCLEPKLAISEALGISPYYSNHEYEAMGLLLALQLLKKAGEREKRRNTFILTNNMGVIQRLDNCDLAKPGQYIFREIEATWKAIQTEVNLTFVWCPGHQGIQGNEEADQLAKATTARNDTPSRTMKANLTKVTSALTAQHQPEGRKALQKRLSGLTILYSALINQLSSGHSPLHQHLFKAKRRLDPTCPFCPGRETTRHLFDFCAQYKGARRRLLFQSKKEKIRCDWNQPHHLLKNPKAHPLIAEFLKATGRFDYL